MRLAIIVEGGVVQNVVQENPENPVLEDLILIDYDSEGVDAEELSLVRQDDRTWSEAIVSHPIVETGKIPVIKE
jgi:hypothetical protein